MYVVTKNNPYYSSVEYFKSLEDAKAQHDEWIEELNEEDGQHDCKVTISKQIQTTDIKTHY